ncbi:MAG: ribonuclease Z, partial [Candidatus Margulisiibacteriota bacterium]
MPSGTRKKIKITFLGTNGWYDTETGNTLCILIETENEYVVLDAGNGIYKLDRYITTDKPIYLFLSHFHLDHIIGLHILDKFKFKQGMHICYKKGQGKLLRFIMSQNFTLPLKKLPTKTDLIEIEKENKLLPFLEFARPLCHPVPCLGLRFKFGTKVIAFIPDTGPCANAIELSRGADLLIAECAMKVGQGSAAWPHLDPVTAAKIAKESNAKKMVLVHFDAFIYKTIKERNTAQQQARII